MNTPIVDFVKKYADSNSLRLHMPGHKGNNFFGCEKYDITEIDGADVLYSADGIIAESQKNATKLFETQSTLYSTEGSSLCIRAMLYLMKRYAQQLGNKPLIAAGRNAHKTFITTAALLDIDVDWLLPENTQTVVSCAITADFIDEYLRAAEQKPTAIYVTSPDYLGNVVDIQAISNICRKYGVLLVVDNAHGAYLKFLPTDIHPISLGADMCCDSAHKTLPALTGGAYLHVGKIAPAFFADNAKTAFGLFASTSPSYLILQSLDLVNKYIADGYGENLSRFIDKLKAVKESLSKNGFTLCGDEPLKITIATKPYGYTGYEMANILLSKDIVCEFADPDYIVFMLTPEISTEDLSKLENVLYETLPKTPITHTPPISIIKKVGLSLHDALYAESEKVKIDQCFGKVSASIDVACPPAIPVVLPGEIIDEAAMESFKYYGIKEWSVIK